MINWIRKLFGLKPEATEDTNGERKWQQFLRHSVLSPHYDKLFGDNMTRLMLREQIAGIKPTREEIERALAHEEQAYRRGQYDEYRSRHREPQR